jgi:hypothetical protein
MKQKTMFVQFILEPLWKVYSVCEAGADVAGMKQLSGSIKCNMEKKKAFQENANKL